MGTQRRFIHLKKYRFKKGDALHHRNFGTANIATLPTDLLFLSAVLDQGQLPACTAYAATAVRDSMKNKLYDPQIQWDEELQFMGNPNADGANDTRVPMAVGVEIGFVPLGSPLPTDNASAWYAVTQNNGFDLFDSIRMAMFQTQNPLLLGLTWMNEWTAALGGMIQDNGQIVDGGHCVKIAGWKFLNGNPYLVIQNSWGTDAGDNGLFYFPREVVNACFGGFGIFYFSDTDNPTIKTLGMIQALLLNLWEML